MKLKNIKYYSTSILLATTLSLSGCSKQTETDNTTQIIKEIETDESENNVNIDKATNIIKDINRYFSSHITIRYNNETGTITITGNYKNNNLPELTEELYTRLNTILEDQSIQTLEITCIGNEINFSKLNISHIKNLTLDNCQSNFNYEPFKNQTYDNISFKGTPEGYAKEIIKDNTTKETKIEYINFNANNDTKNFIKFLATNQIEANSLSIATTEITQDDYSIISNMNINNIEIMFSKKIDKIYNLELSLNPCIESLIIWNTSSNNELGKIQITTEYPKFHFALNGIDSTITENTSFSLPNDATASISSKLETNSFLADLSNLNSFTIYDYNTNEVIRYNSDNDNFEELINRYNKNYKTKKITTK